MSYNHFNELYNNGLIPTYLTDSKVKILNPLDYTQFDIFNPKVFYVKTITWHNITHIRLSHKF